MSHKVVVEYKSVKRLMKAIHTHTQTCTPKQIYKHTHLIIKKNIKK